MPATTGAGTVTIKYGSSAAITVFVTDTLADLKPIYAPIHAKSISGAWQVSTTGYSRVNPAISEARVCRTALRCERDLKQD